MRVGEPAAARVEDPPEPAAPADPEALAETAPAATGATVAPVAPEQAPVAPPAEALVLRMGRYAWAVVGILASLVAVLYLVNLAKLAVIPLLLALFPVALLSPIADYLRRQGMPGALAALITLVGAVGLLVASLSALVPPLVGELPDLADAADQGVASVQEWLNRGPFQVDVTSVSGLTQAAVERLNQRGDLVGQAMTAAGTVAELAAGTFVALIAMFFYLKDGPRLVAGLSRLLPARNREHGREIAGRIWWTVGSYFRGQLLVALVDAVFIGLGLVLLRVPLALPLAVIVFLGGLFPIIGAFVSGLLAVLVALAERGPGVALAVLAVILVVQQLEGHVLQPVIMSRVTHLHPLLVLVALTIGGTTLGILGAFLAVPLAASIARVAEYVQGTDPTPSAQEEREVVAARSG